MMSSQDKIANAPFRTLAGAYAWLNSHINYEKQLDRIHVADEAFKLDPIRDLLARLGNPQRHGLTLHIAGSRGKGSSAMALEALLLAAGLRVATFTSPHLYEYRERIRIDGRLISSAAFVDALGDVARTYATDRRDAESFQTVFELLTATFFLAARRAHVDALIVETGLGGRLDCTNVLDPGGVLLTRIGLEHTHILGDTYEAIASEKAAILKPGGWGISAQQGEPAVLSIFDSRAHETRAPLIRAEIDVPLVAEKYSPEGMRLNFLFEGEPLTLELPLYGPFLAENLQGALAVYQELVRRKSAPHLPRNSVRRALESLQLKGRMQPVPVAASPGTRLIVDGAHCPIGARAVARAMDAHFGKTPAIAVVGMMTDKKHSEFFEALSGWGGWSHLLCYRLESMPRAAPAELIAAAARPYFLDVETCPDLRSALQLALDQAGERAMIVTLGSIFSVGSVLDWSCSHGRT